MIWLNEFEHLALLIFAITPVMLGGIVNMVWVKAPYGKVLNKPIDGGRCLDDGQRVLGNNKTWKGFLGMIVITGFFNVLYHFIVMNSHYLHGINVLILNDHWFPLSSFAIGALLGFAYVLAELPNSFVKRRIHIEPGKNSKGLKGIIFTLLDQSDSVIGCAVVYFLITDLSWIDVFIMILIGSFLHYLVNILLYCLGLKAQAR